MKKKILFVCIENSNRSQMSQAFAIIHGGDVVEAFSAGSKPSGKINPKAIAAMTQYDYDLSKHQSKSLEEVKQFAPFDIVVTMGCGDACPWMPAKKFLDWQIPDPRDMNETEFNKIRDLIEQNVKHLLRDLMQDQFCYFALLKIEEDDKYKIDPDRKVDINIGNNNADRWFCAFLYEHPDV